MGNKGEALIGIFLVAFVASLLAWGTVEAIKNCRLYCKLDLPKYQEISGVSRYGDSDKIAFKELLGPVFGPEVFQITEGGENGSIVKIR